MKVSALISRLSELDPDAEVLLLSGSADISGADELRRVEQQDDWRCEVHFRDDGLSQSLYAPADFGNSMGFDEENDRTLRGPVVLLAAYNANLEHMYVNDFKPKGRTLAQEWVHSEILRTRRGMLEDGTLISRELLLRLLSIKAEQLDTLIAQGRIFAIDVDGERYYPSIFANPRVNAERLQSVTRLLQPLPDESKLDFLLSAWAHLGDRRPIEMLDNGTDYKQVRRAAVVRAQETTRTAVIFFEGQHEVAPAEASPLYTVAAALDPRMPLWSRARATLSEFGFEYPFAPYPNANLFTAFIEKSFEGKSGSVLEGVVCVEHVERGWRICAAWPLGDISEMNETLQSEGQDVVSAAKVVFEHIKRLSADEAR